MDEENLASQEAEAQDESAQAEPVQEAPVQNEQPQEPLDLRGELEKNLKAAQEPEAEEAPLPGEQVEEAPEVNGEVPEWTKAPDSWSADARKKWVTLPDWAKQEAHKREGDFASGREKYEGNSTKLKEFETVLGADRIQQWEQNFGSAPHALGQLLQLNDMASQNPQGFLEWFVQQNQGR